MSLGEKIKELRKEKGMSQVTLADALGVKQSSISSLEGDKIKADTLVRQIAKYFNVEYKSFITDNISDNKKSKSPNMEEFFEKQDEFLKSQLKEKDKTIETLRDQLAMMRDIIQGSNIQLGKAKGTEQYPMELERVHPTKVIQLPQLGIVA